jgi:hypothetical protein
MNQEELDLCKRLQGVFREKMEKWQVGDRYYDTKSGQEMIIYHMYGEEITDDCLRLPFPIDPHNPKRGLWGMIDWNRFSIVPTITGGMWVFGRGKDATFDEHGDIPTIALLKALCNQEGL